MTRGSAIALLVLFAAPDAQAQIVDDERAATGVALFADQMGTHIWSPYAHVGATLPSEVTLDLSWEADIISSASVDVVSAATPHMTEVRNELGLNLLREFADVEVNAGYTYSTERDADTHGFALGAKRGFARDNIELGARYAISFNRLGVAQEAKSSWRPLLVHTADLTFTRVINTQTVAELATSVFYADGFQSNPYRRVPITMGQDLVNATWVEERTPDRRMRAALVGRLRRVLGQRWIGALDYRFYADDWGVTGHTLAAETAARFAGGLGIRLRQRASWQGGANFYSEHYETEMQYRTRDRRLSPHQSGMAGVKLLWRVGRLGSLGELALHLGVDAIAWHYPEFDEPVRSATGNARLVPMGWVFGSLFQLGLEIKP